MLDSFGNLLKGIWEMPSEHPTAGSLLTVLLSIICIAVGLGEMTQNQGGGIALAIIGAVLLAFIVYAVYDTRGFKYWPAPVRGHAITRWIGPMALDAFLVVTLIGAVIAIFLVFAILAGFANS